MDKIEKLIQELYCFEPNDEVRAVQARIVELITEGELHKLIPFFKYDKVLWDPLAEIICECSKKFDIEKNEDLVKAIFEWYQDFTWPGVDVIRAVMITFKRETIVKNLNIIGSLPSDESWFNNLVVDLFGRYNISEDDFQDSSIYHKMLHELYDDIN